ncbi:MAG: aminotransferase class I/II-fold pyridoxal phosphate-dependent enzyme [Desulfobacterales bacterium]|nr:aminotransferase class I/II-fold pyridoxal phosphate-dependent enzyme [Desulfobacterales bacterium]
MVGSFAKTYHTTGWKVGYRLAPRALTAELRKVHQYIVFSVNTPMQHAYADFLRRSAPVRSSLPAFYQAKRDRFLELIRGLPLPSPALPRHLLPDARTTPRLSNEPELAFARRLTVDHGVAAIPPSVFYHDARRPPGAALLLRQARGDPDCCCRTVCGAPIRGPWSIPSHPPRRAASGWIVARAGLRVGRVPGACSARLPSAGSLQTAALRADRRSNVAGGPGRADQAARSVLSRHLVARPTTWDDVRDGAAATRWPTRWRTRR